MIQKIVSASIHVTLVMIMLISSYGIAAGGDYGISYESFMNSLTADPSSIESPIVNFTPSLSLSSYELELDTGIDFEYFNELPHKGNIFNGIPYEYIGPTEQKLSEVFKALIEKDYEDSNLEFKPQYVDTPQMAAQIIALLTSYKQDYDRFFYAVSLSEENNCWVVEHRFYKNLRPDGANTSYFLLNRNDAKIIEVEYIGYYFRTDKPNQDAIPGDPSSTLFGISDWAVDEVNSLNSRGIIPTTLKYNFQQPIRRDEFANLVINIYESIMGEVSFFNSPFTDISDINYVYKKAIEKAFTIDLIDGTSTNTFAPHGLLTREQTAKILCNMAEKIEGIDTKPHGLPSYLDRTSISNWAVDFVAFMQENTIMQGSSSGKFYPQNNLTREEAILVAERLIVQFDW
jgi:hypothetical protein